MSTDQPKGKYPRYDHELLGSAFAQASETAKLPEPQPEALLYDLESTSTVYMDGTAAYHVKVHGKPGIVGNLTLLSEDAATLRRLFEVQRMRWVRE
jgi:hypothetical protein